MPSADAVVATTPLKRVHYASLFTYMYRRFGIPHMPGDDYKDLCGGWMLTTPSPSLVVLVRPSMMGEGERSFMPLYMLQNEQEKEANHIGELDLSSDVVEGLKKAYRTLLVDLLRPVCVRDSRMNAMGTVEDGSPLLRSDRNGQAVYESRRHASAGYGVPQGLVGGKDWAYLCSLIRQAGGGDIVRGKAAAVGVLRASVLAQAASEQMAVKRLILLGCWEERKAIGSAMLMSQQEQEQVEEDLKLLWPAGEDGGEGSKGEQLETLLRETSDDIAEKAFSYLERLGFTKSSAEDTFNRALVNHECNKAWNDLRESGEGNFPEETLPVGEVDGATLVEQLRQNFASAGQDGLTRWLDRTLSLRRGEKVVCLIVYHLQDTLRAPQQDAAVAGT